MNKITLDFYLAKSKTTIKGLLVLFVLLLTTQVGWGQVIISQVYEGASNNKWIEITNVGSSSLDLASPTQYKVGIWTVTGTAGNGAISGTPTSSISLTGTLAAGAKYLIKNTSASATVPHSTMPTADAANITVAGFNGNDALAIFTGTSTIVDAFGVGINNLDISYHRNSNIVSTNSTFTSSEWTSKTLAEVASATNLLSQYIGIHIYSSTSAPIVTSSAASSITTTSATLAGNVTATGGASISANGSVYSLTATNATPQISGTGVTNLATSGPGVGTGAFSNNISATLGVNTQYSFNAYATNSVGTSYGTVSTFYTLANVPSAPTVNSATSSSLDVSLSVNGNPSATEFAIQETGGNYVQANGTLGASAVWQTAATWGTKTITGLSANTSYTFQVKARNGANTETAFSGTSILSTLAGSSPVANITGPLAEESLNGATLQLDITNDTFSATPTSTDFTLNNAPSGVTIGSVTNNSSTSVTLNLLYNGDFDANVTTFSVTIASTVLTSAAALTTNNITLTALTESLSVGTVTAFGNQTVNSTSAEKSFTISGTVRSTVSLVPPAGYEISTGTGVSFVATNPIELTPTATSLSSTTIYVRFKPTAVTAYTGNITATSTAASNATVSLTGAGIAPANPATFTATTATNSQINLVATANGNSNNIVVVYNATGTFTTPSDGGAAGVQGDTFAGGTIWYNGAAVSLANHTGLNAATTYYYKAFSYDSLNFYSAGATANATTVKAEPIAQATSLAFSTITTSSYTTAFSAAAGTPDGYLVIRSANSTLSANPVDGTTYTTSSTVGGGSVVSVGSTITGIANAGLSGGTTYYTFVFAYNNSGATIDYLTTSPLTASTITLSVAPAPTASNVTAISFDINWTAVTGAVSYQLDVTTDAGFTTFVSGFNNLSVSGTSQAVSGLLSNTPYYFRVRAVNASGNSASGSGSQNTSLLTAPVATDASTIGTSGFTSNWGAVTGAASGYLLDVSTSATFGTTTNATDLFISEYFEGSGNNKYIEIYNGTGASVDLSNYKLQMYTNGSATASSDIALSGTLATGSTIVYKNASATLYLGTAASNAAVNFNGDDAIALFKISTASYVDILGRIGTDPGTAWTSGTLSTLDKTLVRKSTVTGGITTNPSTDFTTLATEWDLYNIDVVSNLGAHTFNSFTLSFVSGYNAKPISGQSTVSSAVTGLTAGNTYYYRVRATDGTASTNSNVITVATKPSSVTWNGSAWSNTSGPDADIDAIIAGNYSVAANITAKTLTVNNSAVVTIPSGNNVTVTAAVTVTAPATLTFSNNANLIQGGTTNTNTGDITVKRNSSLLKRLDYTLWSSPVTNAALFLKGFSPNTLDARFYIYNTTFNTGGVNGAFSLVTSPSTTNFITGKGYSIRMPDNASAVTPTAYPGEFTGVPNNGDITASLVDGGSAGLRYNLVGNPYPSPITMSTFVTDNSSNIESTLYFWRKTNGTGSAYCTWVPGGASGTFVTNDNPQAVNPSGIIQTGQGFFVEAKSGATSLSFKNTQRVANNTGQFFRIKQVAEASKIWLNATNAKGDFSQMAITYFAEATTDVDSFDAKYFNDSPLALTSNINNGEYTIQGRPAFEPADVVALNFKTNADGDYTIALDHFEGVFAAGQDVYLVDSKTGTETDLKAGAYTFNATSGIDNTRFSLKYQKTLRVDAPAFNENSVSVYKNNGALYVNSGIVAMSNIKIFDIQGRLIAEQKNLKSTTAVFNNLRAKNQALIVKIIGENNNVVSKKVVN